MNTKKIVSICLALAMCFSLMSTAFAANDTAITVAGTEYTYTTEAKDGYTQIGNSGIYCTSASPLTGTLYGTSALSYADFYAENVNSTNSYDGVSSATTSKYSIMSNMYTDFNAETSMNGYTILGVKNVPVAVDAELYAQAMILNAAGKVEADSVYAKACAITLNDNPTEAVSQYKPLTANGYGKLVSDVKDTITDATLALSTTANWGDYMITVTDPHGNIRNARSDEGFAINSKIQGIVITAKTKSGDEINVGMEYLQNMWVQPYTIAFNVSTDSAKNPHIVGKDNITELSKLVGSTVTAVTYIMPDSTYVYTFENGLYITPAYTGDLKPVAAFGGEDNKTLTVSNLPEEMENVKISVSSGSGRNVKYLAQDVALDENNSITLEATPTGGTEYTISISSTTYSTMTTTASAPIIAGTETTAKCGEGETATFNIVYTGNTALSSARFKLDSQFAILNVESEYDYEFNPENGKVIVYDAAGIESGSVIATVTADMDITPWLANGKYEVQLEMIEATNANAEKFTLATAPATIIIENAYLLGDVNCDGVVSNADLVLLARYLVDLETLSPQALLNADVNQDGNIGNADCVLIARMLVE